MISARSQGCGRAGDQPAEGADRDPPRDEGFGGPAGSDLRPATARLPSRRSRADQPEGRSAMAAPEAARAAETAEAAHPDRGTESLVGEAQWRCMTIDPLL